MMTNVKESKPISPSSQSEYPRWPLVPIRAASRTSTAPDGLPAKTKVSISANSLEEAPDTFGADLARQMLELRRYAIWLCRSADLADDLLQDTLLKAWLARDRFEAGTNLKAWCATILRNGFFSYRRRSWRSQPLPCNESEALAADNTDTSHALDLLALRNAISLLPLDQREAVIIVSVGGYQYVEAAKILECAVGTVKSRVSRARLRLTTLTAENLAGFSSDSSLSASETMNDLMDQVVRITSRTGFGDHHADQSAHPQTVYSEPYSQV